MRSPRHTRSPFERAMRFVTALSMGSVGAVRGCGGGGTVSNCQCAIDAGDEVARGGPGRACSGAELDAGCRTQVISNGAGPLMPPELEC
jgi:hypothetical protein